MIRNTRVVWTVFCSALLMPGLLLADGFRNPPEGAAALGAFGGHRAFADDANATIHNPANLVELNRPMIQLNVLGGYGHTEFDTLNGAIYDETEDSGFYIPGFSAALPFRKGDMAFGLSVYAPFGRSVDWGDDGFFAQNSIPYFGSMTVIDITPNFSVRLNKTLSVSIGADLYTGDVEQKTILGGTVAQALGLPPGTPSTLTADGTGLGCNAALAWRVTENQRLAATVRSPFAIDYSGDNDLGLAGKVGIEGTIDYPTIAALAYGIELTKTIRVEADVEWLQFSNYEQLVIQDSFGGTTTTPQNLEDTWTLGLGMEWDFAAQWTLRSGFMHLQNPTPDETYSPLSPDEDQEVISIGLGYENDHHAFDVAYAFGIFNGRSIQGSVNSPDGNYDYDMQLFSLSYGYKF